MRANPQLCYYQIRAINRRVIMRLQCMLYTHIEQYNKLFKIKNLLKMISLVFGISLIVGINLVFGISWVFRISRVLWYFIIFFQLYCIEIRREHQKLFIKFWLLMNIFTIANWKSSILVRSSDSLIGWASSICTIIDLTFIDIQDLIWL